MKRLTTLIVLLGLVMGSLVTGCNKTDDTTTTTTTDTNAVSTTTTTNK